MMNMPKIIPAVIKRPLASWSPRRVHIKMEGVIASVVVMRYFLSVMWVAPAR